MLRLLLLFPLMTATAFAAEDERKPAFEQPIPEVRLTNGTVFRNVSVVRYDATTVSLKSHIGVGSIAYSMIPEPLRTQMLAERDAAKVAKAKQQRKDAAALAEAEKSARMAKERAANAPMIERAIRQRKLLTGMMMNDVERSWGMPDRRVTPDGPAGRREDWFYRWGSVSFWDGYLIIWSQMR